MTGSPPWQAWADVARRPWAHTLTVPGAALLFRAFSLEEPQPGDYLGVREAVYRAQDGGYLFVRAARGLDGPERLTVIPGRDGPALVAAIKQALGMPPGRLETLGRAGIEAGLEGLEDEDEGFELL